MDEQLRKVVEPVVKAVGDIRQFHYLPWHRAKWKWASAGSLAFSLHLKSEYLLQWALHERQKELVPWDLEVVSQYGILVRIKPSESLPWLLTTEVLLRADGSRDYFSPANPDEVLRDGFYLPLGLGMMLVVEELGKRGADALQRFKNLEPANFRRIKPLVDQIVESARA